MSNHHPVSPPPQPKILDETLTTYISSSLYIILSNINFLFIFSRSRNEVDTLQTYREKCTALETRLEALECNATKLQEYEQVQLYVV